MTFSLQSLCLVVNAVTNTVLLAGISGVVPKNQSYLATLFNNLQQNIEPVWDRRTQKAFRINLENCCEVFPSYVLYQ